MKKIIANILIICLIISNLNVSISFADVIDTLPTQYDITEEQEEATVPPMGNLTEIISPNEEVDNTAEEVLDNEENVENLENIEEPEIEEPEGIIEEPEELEDEPEEIEEEVEEEEEYSIYNCDPFEYIPNELAIKLANIHLDEIKYFKTIGENDPINITIEEFLELANDENNKCATGITEPPELEVEIFEDEEIIDDTENIEEIEEATPSDITDIDEELNIPMLSVATPIQEEAEIEEATPAKAKPLMTMAPKKLGAGAPWTKFDKLYVTWLYRNGQTSHNDEFDDYQELKAKLLDVKNVEGYEQIIIKGKSRGDFGGDASNLFLNATNITYIDMSECDFSNVVLTTNMFKGCTSLESLDLHTLDVSAVTTAASMFYGCTKLKTLNVNGWNTRQISIYQSMFRDCVELEELDLTSWDTDKNNIGIYCTNMFDGCVKLKTIYTSEKFTFDQMESGEGYTTDMFRGCEKLVGGAGTTYNGYTDRRYARLDNAQTGVKGFFSHKHLETDFEPGPGKKSYCTEHGYTEKICKVCGHSDKMELPLDLSSHKYTIITTQSEPTCSKAGTAIAYCELCGVPKPGLLGLLKDPNVHSFVWKYVTTPTCISTGMKQEECEWCGYKNELSRTTCPIDPNNHYDTNWVIVTEPTCTTPGQKKLDCSACHASTVYETIPELGHLPGADLVENPKATCMNTGVRSYTCDRCGTHIENEIVPLQPHTWGPWIIIEEATFTSDGSKKHECSVCHLIETEVIPQKIDFNPEGDDPIGEDEIEVKIIFEPNGGIGSSYTVIDYVGYEYTVSNGTGGNTFLAQPGFAFNGYELQNSANVKIKDLEVGEVYKFETAGTYKLLAKWKEDVIVPPGKGVVTYDPNGGSGSMAGTTQDIGFVYTVLANGFNPPEGKTFDHWLLLIDGNPNGNIAAGATITLAEHSYMIRAMWSGQVNPSPTPTPTPDPTPTPYHGGGGSGGGGGGGSGIGGGAYGPGYGMLSPTDQLTQYQLAAQQQMNTSRPLTRENNRTNGDYIWEQDEKTGLWRLRVCVNPGMPIADNEEAKYYSGWQFVPVTGGNPAWYYIDPATGIMKTGWIEIDGKFFFLSVLSNNLGSQFLGWHNVDNSVCYFDRDSGALEVTLTPQQAKNYGIITEEAIAAASQVSLQQTPVV